MQIHIDFDVYQKLTQLRQNEDDDINSVLRRELKMKKNKGSNEIVPKPGDWLTKGVLFPLGTEFRATFKGKSYHAKVDDGSLVMDGKCFKTPSAAAVHVAGGPVNGWNFWECKIPGKSWRSIKGLRRK